MKVTHHIAHFDTQRHPQRHLHGNAKHGHLQSNCNMSMSRVCLDLQKQTGSSTCRPHRKAMHQMGPEFTSCCLLPALATAGPSSASFI